MSDNLAFIPDNTKTVATDDIGGIHYQILKLAFGPLDTATIVTSAAGLPVTTTAPADLVAALTDGRQTVGVPGTAVSLRTSLACKWVRVTALLSNTDQVNVGGSGVLASAGGSTGTPLLPGQTVTIPASNVNLVFVDARVANDGVSFTVGS